MFDSYNKNKIENTYKRLKRVGIAPTWVRHSRTSVAQMIRNYDGEVAIHGNKAVREIKRRLEKAKSHIVPKTSSMEVYNALMSGKYDKPVLLDFWASWCGPCRMQSPIIDQLAAAHSNVVFGKVNVDEEADLAAEYGITSIPTLIIFRDGRLINQVTGVTSKASLERMLGL